MKEFIKKIIYKEKVKLRDGLIFGLVFGVIIGGILGTIFMFPYFFDYLNCGANGAESQLGGHPFLSIIGFFLRLFFGLYGAFIIQIVLTLICLFVYGIIPSIAFIINCRYIFELLIKGCTNSNEGQTHVDYPTTLELLSIIIITQIIGWVLVFLINKNLKKEKKEIES